MNLAKKKFFIIIQARLNSNRLKGKILKKIDNKEILSIMIDRLKKFKNKLIINISKKNSKKIINLCKKKRVKYFLGSDLNVLKRYYECARFFKARNIVRIPSDCPLIDPTVIEKGLNIFFKNDYDYVTNLSPPTYIDGNDVEIMDYKTLKEMHLKATSKMDREHVTTYLRKNLNNYKYKNFKSKKNNSSKFRLTLDYKEDLEVIKSVVINLGIHVKYIKILNFLKKNKKISLLNKKYIGTMWYQKKL